MPPIRKIDKVLEGKITAVGKPQPDAKGNLPSSRDWPNVQALAVCGTDGCPVAGISFQVSLYVLEDGNVYCMCGRCGQMITDLRGDTTTPVGQDILENYRKHPDILKKKQKDFNRRKPTTDKESR